MLSIRSTRRRDAARRTGPVLVAALAAGLGLAAPATAAPAAPATAAPAAPVRAAAAAKLPATVTADALPTVQIDGVVWDQVVVGTRVYATGAFTRARPAGAKPGQHQTARANVLAYSLTSGKLIRSWAPRLNAQGLAIAASADGKRIFVAGDFTKVGGVSRYRVAALSATTGKPVKGWHPHVNSRVKALAVSGGTLYLGGGFSVVDRRSRSRLAAVSVSTGSLRAWAPAADAEVLALAAPAGRGKVVAGGRFTHLDGADAYGMGALDSRTGAVLPWPVNTVVQDAGHDSAIYSLTSDGAQVYGTGYVYGPGGNFEGSFAARSASGTLVWVNGCRGDTYDSRPVGGVLYTVSHAHDCSAVGWNPETHPRRYQRAQAETTAPAPSGARNTGGAFDGRPAPRMLHWLPTLSAGSYTGTGQAAWTVEGTSSYLVLGGEFPKVNGRAQQGLVRFAIRRIAPGKQGPLGRTGLTPTLSGSVPGQVTGSWEAAWDRDDGRLSYQVLRGRTVKSAKVVLTTTRGSAWWSRPTVPFTDASPPAGLQTYRVRVRDSSGNTVVGAPTSISVPDVSG